MEEVMLASLNRPVHGTNPMNLVEKILKTRIVESSYWQQYCFAMNEASLLERACELEAIGGVCNENNAPTPFLCLVLKMLQMSPSLEIVKLLLTNGEFKYTRALAAFYVRLTRSPVEIFSLLEPLYIEFSKLRVQERTGWSLTTMDQFIDDLLHDDIACDIVLPRLAKRHVLVENAKLPLYISPLSFEESDNESDISSVKQASDSPQPAKNQNALSDSGERKHTEPFQKNEDHNNHAGKRERKKKAKKKKSKESGKRQKKQKTVESSKDVKSKLFIKGLKMPTAERKMGKKDEKQDPNSIQAQNTLRLKLGLAPLNQN